MLTILLFFVAAQLSLALASWLGGTAVRWEPALGGRSAAVTEVTYRPARVEAARKERARSQSDIASITKRLARARQRLADMIPMAESPASAAGYAVLAFILYEGESTLALLLNLAARFGNMSNAVAAFFSPIIAAALIAGLHVILGAIISVGVKHRPDRIVIRAKAGAAIFGTAVVVAFWAVFSGRAWADPNLIETVTSVGLTVLAVVLAIAGACSSLVVTTVNSERALEQQVARLERLETVLRRHLEAIERDLQQYETQSASAEPAANTDTEAGHDIDGDADGNNGEEAGTRNIRTNGSGKRSPRGADAVTVATGFVFAFLLAHPALAQTAAAGRLGGSVSAARAPEFSVTPHSCELAIDVSRSVDAAAREDAIDRFGAQFNTLSSEFDCDTIRASAFSGYPPFNVLREVSIPAARPALTCVPAAASDASATKLAVQWLYPFVGAAHQNAAIHDCLAQQQHQRDIAFRERQLALDSARGMFKDLGHVKSRGSCTALDFAVRRAVRRSQHVFVFSDGANSCDAIDALPQRNFEPTQTLTFLLLPSATANAGALSIRHSIHLESIYPSSRVLFAVEVTPTLWQTLKPVRQ